MNKSVKSTIVRLSLTSMVLTVASMVVPRLLPSGDGLASAASAALTFLVLLLVASSVAIYALVLVCQRWGSLSAKIRFLGIFPVLVIVTLCAYIYIRIATGQ